MNKRFYFAAAVVVLFAVLFAGAVWFAYPFQLFVLALVPLVWIGLPTAFVAAVYLFSAARAGRSRRPALVTLSVVFGFACFVGLALPANHFVQERAVDAAKAYPERVAPLLEAYRHSHGSYPAHLDQLSAAPPLPRLLRRWGYRSDGHAYSFTFPQPGGLLDAWVYDSKTRQWFLST